MKLSLNLALVLVLLVSMLLTCDCIKNSHYETENMVIYLTPRHRLGPSTWNAGVDCLSAISKIYFTSRENLTRSYNMVIGATHNMSTPAAQIHERFLRHMNEEVSQRLDPFERHYQVRTVFDGVPYVRYRMGDSAVIYADCYVLIVDSVERLRLLMRDYVSRTRSWNPGATFLVLFNNIEYRDMEREIVMEIFSEFLQTYFVHWVGVLYARADLEYSFSVMDYYNNIKCRTVRMRQIGNCNDGKPQPDADTVRRKLQLFQRRYTVENCTFRMCATVAAPFVEADCVTGIEMRIIGFIRARLKYDLNQTCKVGNRGVREENDSWTGLLGKLQSRDCDFILGGLYPDNEVLENFWTTDCYLQDSHTWFVKLAEPRPAWMALYSIFDNTVWLCFIILLFVTWFFWYIFVNILPEPPSHKQLSITGINAMAISICVAINERPEYCASRVFFLVVTIYGMNVVSIYTSQLITVFQNPGYLHQIDTMEQVRDAGIPFGGLDENQDWFENEQDMWIHDAYNDSELFLPDSQNLVAVKYGKRVILTSRMYILQHSIADDVYAFPKNVFSSPLQMIMKAGFPLMREFNTIIRTMRDVGIFQKIDQDFRYKNMYLNRIAKMRPEYKESVIVLTTGHLQGPFAILIVGIFTSILLFVCELCLFWLLLPALQRFRTRKRRNDATKVKIKAGSKKANKKGVAEKPAKMKVNRKIRKKRQQPLFYKNTKQKETLTKVLPKQTKKINNFNWMSDVNIVQTIRFTPIKRPAFGLK